MDNERKPEKIHRVDSGIDTDSAIHSDSNSNHSSDGTIGDFNKKSEYPSFEIGNEEIVADRDDNLKSGFKTRSIWSFVCVNNELDPWTGC